MPILPAEPEIFPEGLLTAGLPNSGSALERNWLVLHTRPRQEKSVGRYLREREIPYYLPQSRRENRIRNRVLVSQIPLFPGYLFALVSGDERIAALGSGRIVRALHVTNQDNLWHDLRQLHRLIALGFPVSPEEKLTPGTQVEVRTGPLAGLQGKIIRGATGHRFVVEINFLQQGASVLLDASLLSPVSPPGLTVNQDS